MSRREELNSIILSHLSASLLALEIDVAQLETKLFLLFNDLRELHESSASPALTALPPTTPGSVTPASLLPPAVIQSHSLRILDGILEAEKLEVNIYETLVAARLQLEECSVEDQKVVELKKQARETSDGLDKSRETRSRLEQWADDIYFSCHFKEMVGVSRKGASLPEGLIGRENSFSLKVARPQSLLTRCPSKNSILTIPHSPSSTFYDDDPGEEEKETIIETVTATKKPKTEVRGRLTKLRKNTTRGQTHITSPASTISTLATAEPPIAELPVASTKRRQQQVETRGTMGWDISELQGTEVTWDAVKNQKREPFSIQRMQGTSVIVEEEEAMAPKTSVALHPSVSVSHACDTPEPTPTYSYEPEWLQFPQPRYTQAQRGKRQSRFGFLLMRSEDKSDSAFRESHSRVRDIFLMRKMRKVRQFTWSGSCTDILEKGGKELGEVMEYKEERGGGFNWKKHSTPKIFARRGGAMASPRPMITIE